MDGAPRQCHGTLQTPVDARYVRVELTSSGTMLPGLRELEVR